MRASCEFDHERVTMEQDHVHKRYVCPKCGESLTPERIERAIPAAFRRQSDPFAETIRNLLDYEVEGVWTDEGLLIEYPRRGQ